MQASHVFRSVVKKSVVKFRYRKLVGAHLRVKTLPLVRNWSPPATSLVRVFSGGNSSGQGGRIDIFSIVRTLSNSGQSSVTEGKLQKNETLEGGLTEVKNEVGKSEAHEKEIEEVKNEMKEVKEKIKEVEMENEEVKKKIEAVEKKIEAVEKVKGLSWDTLTVTKQKVFQDEVGLEKWKMERLKELQEKENKLQDKVNKLDDGRKKLQDKENKLQDKENILLKQMKPIDNREKVDTVEKVLAILAKEFPKHPHPRTNVELCASIQPVEHSQLLDRDNQLTKLYTLWSKRMFNPKAITKRNKKKILMLAKGMCKVCILQPFDLVVQQPGSSTNKNTLRLLHDNLRMSCEAFLLTNLLSESIHFAQSHSDAQSHIMSLSLAQVIFIATDLFAKQLEQHVLQPMQSPLTRLRHHNLPWRNTLVSNVLDANNHKSKPKGYIKRGSKTK